MHFKLHIRRVQLIINPRGIIISFMCIQVAPRCWFISSSSSASLNATCETALAFRCYRTRTGFVRPPLLLHSSACINIILVFISLEKCGGYTYPYCSLPPLLSHSLALSLSHPWVNTHFPPSPAWLVLRCEAYGPG